VPPPEELLLEALVLDPLPPVPPLLDDEAEELLELDEVVPAPELTGQVTGSHSAGTPLGSQPGSLVCACKQTYVSP
jgi:hypothetical protein